MHSWLLLLSYKVQQQEQTLQPKGGSTAVWYDVIKESGALPPNPRSCGGPGTLRWALDAALG